MSSLPRRSLRTKRALTMMSDEALKFSIKLAKEAGALLLSYQKKIKTLKVGFKEKEGVFSKADTESEKLIKGKIQKKYPGHFILAEESSYKTEKDSFRKCRESPYSWIVDPLDGTSNYLNQFDYFSVCMALAHFGNPILGVVHRPTHNESFFSVKGGGAFFQKGEKIMKIPRSTNRKRVKDSLLITGFSTEKGRTLEEEFGLFKKISSNCRGVRRMGSAALDMCYVALGVFDGFWEASLSPWDVAASGIICLESNVRVTDFKGSPFSPFQKTFLAAREPFFGRLKRVLQS
jgi:myo-inositol-1(or 4)-monophosphatase